MEMAGKRQQPFIETADIKTALDGASLEKQPGAKLYPFMEMALIEVESVKFETEGADRDRYGSSIRT
jgi:hypothetical protein